MLIGESYIGQGAEAAHVNTILGERAGPVGVAWTTALATPSAGHTLFVAVVIPGLPVKPMTLFVNKAPIADDGHGTLTWGAAQAGVAGGPGAGARRRGRRRPGAVKIPAIRLDRLRLPLDPPFRAAWDPVPRRHFDATLVRVETDEGITGFGSGDTMDGFASFADLFIGRDPREIARHVLTIETINFHAGRYWP